MGVGTQLLLAVPACWQVLGRRQRLFSKLSCCCCSKEHELVPWMTLYCFFFLSPFCSPSTSDSNAHILSMGHPQWHIRDSLTWIAPQVPSPCWGLALPCTLLFTLKVGPSTRKGKGAMPISKEIRSSLAVVLSSEVALIAVISPQEWHTGIFIFPYSCCCCC